MNNLIRRSKNLLPKTKFSRRLGCLLLLLMVVVAPLAFYLIYNWGGFNTSGSKTATSPSRSRPNLGNTRGLLALVNDLLDMSRLEAQTLVIRPTPLDLHSLIHDVTQSMRPQIEERRQRLSLRLASSPLTVLGDENRLGQILTNLLTFATNHTPVGGRIEWQTQSVDSMARIT